MTAKFNELRVFTENFSKYMYFLIESVNTRIY